MSAVCERFDFLTPKTLLRMDDMTIVNKCDKFQMRYADILGSNFSLQYLNIYKMIKPELTETWTVHQLCSVITKKLGALECDFTEVYTAMLLFHTIPVTSASAERSFSKLKIIKNYLRNSMAQDRLRYLSLLAIENIVASNLDLSEVIDRFAQIKARKKL